MTFTEALHKEGILLFDGGMGTMLQAQGLIAECPEMLNQTHQAEVAAIHRAYREAGADVVETNSLGLNTVKMAKHGLESEIPALAQAAVEAARLGVGEDIPAAFSIGPTGDFLAPYGSLTFDALYQAFVPAFAAAEKAGAAVLYIETQCDLTETRVAMLAAREQTALPYVPSFTFEGNGRTVMGNPPAACAVLAQRLGAVAVGINCSGGPEELLPVVKAMRAATTLPLIVQPNAGLPEFLDGVTRFPFSPQDMAEKMPAILEAGADGIGGCCGTTPAHIARLRELIAGRSRPRHPDALPETLSHRRVVLPLAEALAALGSFALRPGSTLSDDMEDWMDETEEAEAMLLDVSAVEPEEIAALLDEEQDLMRRPLLFRAGNAAQAEAALRHYCGITALYGPGLAEAAARYGAYYLGE